jgi:hypothetical protein
MGRNSTYPQDCCCGFKINSKHSKQKHKKYCKMSATKRLQQTNDSIADELITKYENKIKNGHDKNLIEESIAVDFANLNDASRWSLNNKITQINHKYDDEISKLKSNAESKKPLMFPEDIIEIATYSKTISKVKDMNTIEKMRVQLEAKLELLKAKEISIKPSYIANKMMKLGMNIHELKMVQLEKY